MGETTKISWTTSTYNPWIGCTKVSVSAADGDTSKGGACDNCYAEELDRVRFSKTMGGATKEVPIIHWGPGAPRYRTVEATRNAPHKWNKVREIAMSAYARGTGPKPERHRVFCASLADVFDNEVPSEWRRDLWSLIAATPYLDWLLVTKRVGLVERMVPPAWLRGAFPGQVRLLISVSNEYEAQRDLPKLFTLPTKNGVSYEPALGPVDWRPWLSPRGHVNWGDNKNPSIEDRRTVLALAKAAYYEGGSRLVEWVIVGGESEQGAGKARPFDREWAYSTIRQCKAADVPCFVKQLGSNVVARNDEHGCDVYAPNFLHRAGADPAEWPEDLRIQEFPS